MEKDLVIKALETLKKEAKERKFDQSYDIIVTLKDIDLKKTDNQLDFYFKVPHGLGKDNKVCGLVGPELIDDAKKILDKAIIQDDFASLDKKQIKKLAREYDYFVAQANVMTKVAAAFGRIFGPRGKMPNPKAGCVVPPKADLAGVKANLASTIRLKTKNFPMIQGKVGNTSMDEKDIIENINATYESIVHHLPQEKNNVKAVYLKLSMSKAVKVM